MNTTCEQISAHQYSGTAMRAPFNLADFDQTGDGAIMTLLQNKLTKVRRDLPQLRTRRNWRFNATPLLICE